MAKRKNFSPEIREKTRRTATAASKNIRGRILIVCEGKETEPNYFNSFPKIDNVSVVTYGGEGCPSQVVEKASELRDNAQSPYDVVWVVFDKDDFTDFKTAIDAAHEKEIRCAWSNEAFELWFLYHFEILQIPLVAINTKAGLRIMCNKGQRNKNSANIRNLVIRKTIRISVARCWPAEETKIMP